jgi:hypothetical protein
MARKTQLTKAAEQIGTAVGRTDRAARTAGKAVRTAGGDLQQLTDKAAKQAWRELRDLRKKVDRLARDLKKASKRFKRSLG